MAGLGRASIAMGSASMVSRVLGVVRNALLVACVGELTGTSQAFQTANTLPNLVFMLLSGGVLTAVLIPEITRAMARPDGGREVVDRLLTASFGLVAVVTVLATASAAPLIVAFRLEGPVRDLGIFFAYLCLPQIFFYGVYAILGQVLNAHDRFAAFMWTPVLANVVQIGGMAIFLSQYVGRLPAERWTPGMVWLLAGTSTLGIAVQAAALLPALRGTGFRFRPRWGWRGHGFRRPFVVASWTITAVVLAQLGGVLVQVAINTAWADADRVGQQVAGIMVYTLAFQVFMVPHSIVTTSILTALYPRMARSVHAGDTDALRGDVVRGLQLPATAMVPLTFAAVALAVPGVKVVTPSLTPQGVGELALAFSIMALGLYPFGVSALQQRYSLARGDGRANLRYQGFVTGVQLASAVAAVLVPPAWAVATICAGQTLGNTAASVWFLVRTQRQLGGLPLRGLAVLVLRLVAASAPAAAAAWLVVGEVAGRLGTGWLGALAQLAAGGVAFVVVFGGLAVLLRIPEVTGVLARVLGRGRG